MTPIEYAISSLKHDIPRDVLNYAFHKKDLIPTSRWNIDRNRSIDAIIRADVIEDRVLVDCSLEGGKTIYVNLAECEVERIGMYENVFRIPSDLIDHRSIVGVENVVYYDSRMMDSYYYSHGGNDLASAGMDLLNAVKNIPKVGTANVELLSENVVHVKDSNYINSYHRVLVCRVSNDKYLNDIPKGVYMEFAKLVNLAVKAHIYNKTAIHIGRGALHNGQELPEIRRFIESYADANQQYLDFFQNTWGAVMTMSDVETMHRFIKGSIGRGF